jgi:hypothetical protein
MKKMAFYFIPILAILGCAKDSEVVFSDLNNLNGMLDVRKCWCSTSAFKYLVMTIDNNDTVYYNPVNLPENFKDKNYKIKFSANLLTDSSIVYKNAPNDALIEDFKVRNIKLTNIQIRSDLTLNDSIEIAFRRLYNNYDFDICIMLDSVTEDSRCPKSVVCVWEGNAKAKFSFTRGNTMTEFSLNTASSFRKDTTVAGFKIQLLGLMPYPVVPGIIKQADYIAEIKISKSL